MRTCPVSPNPDPVDAMLNAISMINFVSETLTTLKAEEPYEISSEAATGLYFILDTVAWSIEVAAEKLIEEEKQKQEVEKK